MGLVRQRRRDEQNLPGLKTEDVWPKDESKERRDERIKQEVSDDLNHSVKTNLTNKIDRRANIEEEKCTASSEANSEKDAAHENEEKAVQDEEFAKDASPKASGEDKTTPAELQSTEPESTKGKEPSATQQWSTSAEDSPLKSPSGEKRDKQMEVIRGKKEDTSRRLWQAKKDRKDRDRRRQIIRQRRERGLVATVAERTPEGDFYGQRADKDKHESREGEEEELAGIDFSNQPGDIVGDQDAALVQQNLSDVVKKLDEKRIKIHSLMGAMFRVKGLQPGIDQPGRVLVHEV